MHVVITIDQRGSRRGADLVEALLVDLNGEALQPARLRDFERTAGDEVQGVLRDAAAAVDLALRLACTRSWSTGLGVGPVREPLPASTRAGAGPAFEHARDAVERAKLRSEGVAVGGPHAQAADDAEAVLQLLAALGQRRSPAGVEVVSLLAEGLTQGQAAERLGITKQAVSQRLRTALWSHEERIRPLAGRLLERAADAAEVKADN